MSRIIFMIVRHTGRLLNANEGRGENPQKPFKPAAITLPIRTAAREGERVRGKGYIVALIIRQAGRGGNGRGPIRRRGGKTFKQAATR